jgi:hypothetical protein
VVNQLLARYELHTELLYSMPIRVLHHVCNREKEDPFDYGGHLAAKVFFSCLTSQKSCILALGDVQPKHGISLPLQLHIGPPAITELLMS